MSESDPLDELAGALFAAARRDHPTDAARARALEGHRLGPVIADSELRDESVARPSRAPQRRRPMYVVLALAAAALVTVLVSRVRRDEPVAIGPEAPSARRAEVRPPTPSTSEPSAVIVPEPAPKRALPRPTPHEPVPRTTVEAPPIASAPPPQPRATLSEEVAALDRARTALTSGDTSGALQALDDYDHVLHGTRLSEEATLLRVEALSRSGHADAAARLARAFVAANSGSPLAERARGFAGVMGSGEVRADGGTK